jgi:hypothetical protein
VRLEAHIRRRLRYPEDLIRKAREREENLDQLLRLLRELSISNPARFLVPLPLNAEIRKALVRWKRQWKRDGGI